MPCNVGEEHQHAVAPRHRLGTNHDDGEEQRRRHHARRLSLASSVHDAAIAITRRQVAPCLEMHAAHLADASTLAGRPRSSP